MSEPLRNPVIQIQDVVFDAISAEFKKNKMEFKDWYLRLGAEIDAGQKSGFRRTVIPIRSTEYAQPRDTMHIDPRTGVVLVIDDLSLRRWDGSKVTEVASFASVVAASIAYRKRRDDAIDQYAITNGYAKESIILANCAINGKNVIDYCPTHEVAFDLREGKCPKCKQQSGGRPVIEPLSSAEIAGLEKVKEALKQRGAE
jgi:hypothetical protein